MDGEFVLTVLGWLAIVGFVGFGAACFVGVLIVVGLTWFGKS